MLVVETSRRHCVLRTICACGCMSPRSLTARQEAIGGRPSESDDNMIGTESGAVSSVRKDQIDLDIKWICIYGNKRRLIPGQPLSGSENFPRPDQFSAPC